MNDEINKKIIKLQIQKKTLTIELEELKKVLNKNKNFKNYIFQMRLSVQNEDGIKTPVNAKTIIGYTDNNEYISAKINILKKQIVKIDNEIHTSDLKSLSGAVFNKIVFSFKLAYIYCLEHFANINIPIILDSPRAKEIDINNVKK